MRCPECGGEFSVDVTVCPTCGTDRLGASPDSHGEPDLELVPIFVTGEAGLIPLVKSLLEGEAIEYMVRGEGLQDLFGGGGIGSGFSLVGGPAEFWVREDDAERARELLQDLNPSQGTSH